MSQHERSSESAPSDMTGNDIRSGTSAVPDSTVPISEVLAEASRWLVEGYPRTDMPTAAEDAVSPFAGDHEAPGSPENSIEYWVWSGERLIPATPEQVCAFQAQEEAQRQEQLRRKLQTPPPSFLARCQLTFARWWRTVQGELHP